MKKRITAIALAALLIVTALGLTSCTAATQSVSLTFTDASGAGTLVSTVLINAEDGSGQYPTNSYIKDVQRMAEHLQSKVDRLTSTEGIYKIAYGGKVSGGEAITMTYSFTDINDYNKRTMRLFYCVPRSVRNSLGGLGDEYKLATWTQEGDKLTFSQSGDIFTAINLWAYDYLLHNDIEGAWDNTGNGQTVQLSLFGNANDATFVLAGKDVSVTIGNDTAKVAAFNGETAVAVTASGTVSGNYVAADTSVTDESLIVEHPPEETSSEPDSDEASAEKAELHWVYPVSTGAIALLVVIAVAVALAQRKNTEGENNA